MKKLFIFLTMLVLGIVSSWATDVTWESLHGWTQSSGGVGSFKWYGVHTPGDNTITYSMSSIQLKQSSGNNNTNYLAIATVSPGSSTTITEGNVLAVSSNSIKATASTLYEYTFSPSVTLTGGTTYYLVFVKANTPTGGSYTIQDGRMEVNHLNCYAYPYGNNASVDWFPYFKATLTTTNSTKHYSYSCKNLAGYFLSSGYLLQDTDPTTGDAPAITGYTCQSATVDATGVTFTYALTSNPLASATTSASDMATKPKYITIESTAGNFVYYAEEGGAVKGWKEAEHSKDEDDAHWIIVGDETNGYKLYNALTGTSKVAVVANGNGEAIQMKDESSNTASLFDIRYISGSHRLYKKGTKWCTNRLSSSSRLMGIHTNVNDGSKADVSRYSKTVTYKLKWNNSEITSQNVSVPTGDDPADYLPSGWNRAYCNYTCDVSYVTTETSTVNVTIDWDGPFDFSTDYASAKWYYLKLNNKYVYYDTETTHLLFSNDRVEDPKALWAFFGNPYNGVKVANLNVGDGYFINNDTPATMETSGYVNNQIGSNAWGFYLQDNGWFIYDDGSSGHVGSAQATGYEDRSNVTMKVEYIVTYNLKFGGSTIATKTVDKVTGDSEDLLPSEWERDFCTYSYEPAEIGNSTTSVDVTMTWSGPFDISADYENAIWYYLAVNGKWGKNNSSGFSYTPDFASDIADVKGTDGGQWAFFGNPYDGFLLSLKEKFNNTFQVYLSSQLEAPGFTAPSYSSTEKWTVKSLSGTTFTLNCGDKYLVDNTSTMGFKTTALEGSEGTFSVRSYYCQQALDDLADFASTSAVGQYFGVRQESIAAIQGAFENMPKMTSAEYTTYSVPTGVAGFLNTKYPTTGYYRIKNNSTGNYLAYGTPTVSGGGNRPAGLIATSNSTDAASVIHLTGSKGTYKLSVQGLNIQSQTGANVAFPGTDAEGVDFVFDISSYGIVSIKNTASAVAQTSRDGSLHEASDGWGVHGVVNWDASAANSKWVVEDATSFSGTLTNANDNTGTGHSYATLCVPFAISSITGASAYVPTEDGNSLSMGDALETPIVAGTPVMLVGATNAGSYTANIKADVTPVSSPDDSHILKGTFTGTSIDCTKQTGTNYVLGFDRDNDNRIGFYHVNSSSYSLKANRAYLNLTGGDARGFTLMFDDVVTGIVAPIGETEEGTTIYNLSGQRLNKMQKGINIVNGKKVLF